jgi:hypothetical protein
MVIKQAFRGLVNSIHARHTFPSHGWCSQGTYSDHGIFPFTDCAVRAPTRKESQISEAAGYKNIAVAHDYWGLLPDQDARDAVLLEERALDSYHNILFSRSLIYSRFKTWPTHITVVSHGFKKERLIDGHCAAIGLSLDRINFIGIDPPGMVAASKDQDKEDAMKGVGLALGEWKDDPHGTGEVLAGKRAKRNPWGVWQGYFPRDFDQSEFALETENGSEAFGAKTSQP